MSFKVRINHGYGSTAVEIKEYLELCRAAWAATREMPYAPIVSAPFDHGKKYLLTTYRLPGRDEPSFNITTLRDFAAQNASLLVSGKAATWQSPISLHDTMEEARRAMIAAKPPRRDRIKPGPPPHGTPPAPNFPPTETRELPPNAPHHPTPAQ